MSERAMRSMYYIDGSAVRKMEHAPARRMEPARRPAERPDTNTRTARQRRVSEKTDRALAFNLKYTVFVVSAVFIMVAACVVMLYMESESEHSRII